MPAPLSVTIHSLATLEKALGSPQRETLLGCRTGRTGRFRETETGGDEATIARASCLMMTVARTPLHHRRPPPGTVGRHSPPHVDSRMERSQDGSPLLQSRLPLLMVELLTQTLRMTIHR